MTITKPILLAAALISLAGPAFAGDGDQPPGLSGLPQVLNLARPGLDVGSEAYPTTRSQGATSEGRVTNHVTRQGVPAYQRGFDVGSEAYPTVR